MVDRTGLYALFNLDGAPLDRAETEILGLAEPDPMDSAAALAVDLADPGAVQVDRSDGALTILLGRIDDTADLAERLGRRSDTPQAVLAREALARFGEGIRTLIHGEWTLLRWDGECVTLAASLARRDPVLFAHLGTRLAIAPDLRQLSRLAWVGAELDPVGMFFAIGRQDLRAAGGAATPLAGVRRFEPGGFLTVDRKGIRLAPRALPQASAPWRGSFDEAMEQADALLMRIVRQRMVGARFGGMLSGGLDSSTLAVLLARNLKPTEMLRFLTSAAPPQSGLVDESEFAAIVADHLGAPLERVVPDATPSVYRPTEAMFRERNGPALGVRWFLYDAFAARARALDLPLLFDGQFGELTFSYPLPLRTVTRQLRLRAARFLGRSGFREAASAREAFHVLVAPRRLADLPREVSAALGQFHDFARMPARSERWGILPAAIKAMRAPASLDLGRTRIVLPFRDPRILALFSGFPAGILYTRHVTRRPARHLLQGHLPDSIRLREQGLPFSPDYLHRLRSEAPAARARIATFRRADVDAWLDLDALDQGLARIEFMRDPPLLSLFQLQLTVVAAEFIAWWRGVS